MQTKIYPKFYKIYRHKDLLINKCVAGFYIPEQSAQSIVYKKGFYYQTIRINDNPHLFVYKEFSLPTFFPFSRGKLSCYLDDVGKMIQDNIGAEGSYQEDIITSVLNMRIQWVGVANGSSDNNSSDRVSIITPSGKKIEYLKESGSPTLIPYYEVFFRPLGYFYV